MAEQNQIGLAPTGRSLDGSAAQIPFHVVRHGRDYCDWQEISRAEKEVAAIIRSVFQRRPLVWEPQITFEQIIAEMTQSEPEALEESGKANQACRKVFDACPVIAKARIDEQSIAS